MKVALVGSPNVGKSVIFNYLTGTYVTVSNYPGTTVDITRGEGNVGGRKIQIIDTPGTYSLLPITDEERVTRELLWREHIDVVVHVVDAKNLPRMLHLTFSLMDAGLPLILNLNIMDEAKEAGITINVQRLAELLGIPVIPTSAVNKKGLENLKYSIAKYQYKPVVPNSYSEDVEQVVSKIIHTLASQYGFSKRMVALLLLQDDKTVHDIVSKEAGYKDVLVYIEELAGKYTDSLSYVLAIQRKNRVDAVTRDAVVYRRNNTVGIMDKIGELTRRPATGIPILCLVLYYGIYKFVGEFGAGFLVDYININIFTALINPVVEGLVNQFIPWPGLNSLILGEYGLFSLGFRYATAIILPIVGTFFLMFAILEDCGYLPRLAMLVDRLFKHFGLNGRAVIPITLGLGCGTMAVVVTRTLETKRERLLATFLLTLTIPCSAQLGVVLALLSHNQVILGLWSLYIVLVFIGIGWLSAKILPGERSAFYIEIPPMRVPILSNVLTKAYTRMSWYFYEVLPVFLLTSFMLWLGDRSGILPAVTKQVEPVMTALGLPRETAGVFLMGFFRRDYGAAGLYDMSIKGILSDYQLLVATVTLTLFVPCIAQFVVIVKERGILVSVSMVVIVAGLAFFFGWLMHQLLMLMGVL